MRTRQFATTSDPAALRRYDFNRDGVVNVLDVAAVRGNQRRTLSLIAAPAAAPAAARVARAAAAGFGDVAIRDGGGARGSACDALQNAAPAV